MFKKKSKKKTIMNVDVIDAKVDNTPQPEPVPVQAPAPAPVPSSEEEKALKEAWAEFQREYGGAFPPQPAQPTMDVLFAMWRELRLLRQDLAEYYAGDQNEQGQ